MGSSMDRDLNGKDVAWYRFTETPGKVYGPKDMAFVFRAYGDRSTCEVTGAGEDGSPSPIWFSATMLRARLKSQALQPAQRRRLLALGVDFDESTLDKSSARDLIEQAELQQPASAEAIQNARARGAKVIDGMTVAALNRALIPIEEAEDAIEEEQDRRDELAHERERITRHGIAVDEAISEDELQLLNDEWESYEFAVQEARELGLTAAWIKARRPRTAGDLRRITLLLEAYREDAAAFDSASSTLWLQGRRVPSEAALRRAQMELLSLREQGAAPEHIDAWILQAMTSGQADTPTRDAGTPIAPTNAPPNRQRSRPPVPETSTGSSQISTSAIIVSIGVVAAILLLAAVVSSP